MSKGSGDSLFQPPIHARSSAQDGVFLFEDLSFLTNIGGYVKPNGKMPDFPIYIADF